MATTNLINIMIRITKKYKKIIPSFLFRKVGSIYLKHNFNDKPYTKVNRAAMVQWANWFYGVKRWKEYNHEQHSYVEIGA